MFFDVIKSNLFDSISESNSMEPKNTIQENELVKNLSNGAVTLLRIVEDKKGKYQTFVQLSWREGEIQVVTQRKKPKQWASLDRLAAHIKKYYYGNLIPVITLQLQGAEDETR